MILIIDNYDSFTYNLSQQIAGLGHIVEVRKNDKISIEQISSMNPTHIVISAGPKRPENSGISLEVIRQFYKTIPILGVCLGHQCIGEVFGSHVIKAQQILHGKVDSVNHTKSGLFRNLSTPLIAARYNSLVLDSVPKDFTLTGWSDDGSIMALQHKKLPVFGVQFHPDSFMTPKGDKIISNFILCKSP